MLHVAIRDSRIGWPVSDWPARRTMSFQTRHKIAPRKRRSSAASVRSLSERLYDWRRKNDLSQSEAALRLKVSKRTLQEWGTWLR